MKLYISMIALLLCGFVSAPVFAQVADSGQAQSADQYLMNNPDAPAAADKKAEEAAAPVKKEPESPDMIAKKLELAKKMHELRPARKQVDAAIEQVSKGIPEEDRVPFVTAMKSVLNYNAIEKISIDAMVETFSLSELQAMVDYHTKPEAISITEKMPEWIKKVQPEVIRMIDSAMMRVNTGRIGEPGMPKKDDAAAPVEKK